MPSPVNLSTPCVQVRSKRQSPTVTDSAPHSPQTVSLTGTGISSGLGLSIAPGGSDREARRREECQIFALHRGRRDEWYGNAELYRSTQGHNLQPARDRSYPRNPTHGFHSKRYEPGTQLGRTPSNPFPACALAICLSHDGWIVLPARLSSKHLARRYPLSHLLLMLMFLFLRRRRFQRHAEGNIHPNDHGQVGKQKRANAAHTFGTVNWDTHPRTRVCQERTGHHQKKEAEWGR